MAQHLTTLKAHFQHFFQSLSQHAHKLLFNTELVFLSLNVLRMFFQACGSDLLTLPKLSV